MRKSAMKKPLDGAVLLMPDLSSSVSRPLFNIPAGYPSAAQDYMEQELDIVDYLMGQRRASIFCFRVRGDSMKEAGMALRYRELCIGCLTEGLYQSTTITVF